MMMMKLPSLLAVAIAALACRSHAAEHEVSQSLRLGTPPAEPVIEAKKPYVHDARVEFRQRKESKSSKAAKSTKSKPISTSSKKSDASKSDASKSEGNKTESEENKSEGNKSKSEENKKSDASKSEEQDNDSESSGDADEDVLKSEPVRLNNISLGNKRSEGIAAGNGDYMFVSELLYGGVKKINIKTGETEQVVPSIPVLQRAGLGLAYHQNALFVAGGGDTGDLSVPAMLYVYDVETGQELAKCTPPDGEFEFLNDVTIVEDYAYVTDSFYNKLMVVDAKTALDGDCVVEYIEIPAKYFLADPAETFPRANGIVGYGNGLVIARTNPGGLYFMNLKTKETIELVTPEDAPSNDGLAIADNLLYSAESSLNTISVWSLKGKDNVISANFEGRIHSDDFNFPATIAVYGDYICTVNAHLKSLPLPVEEEGSPAYSESFYVTCVGRFDFD